MESKIMQPSRVSWVFLPMIRDLRTREVIITLEHQPKVVNWQFEHFTGRGKTVSDALRDLAIKLEEGK